jgi:CRP/FNR family transcriptional regulator
MADDHSEARRPLTGLDLDQSCRNCSLSELCLPVALDSAAVDELSAIVEHDHYLQRGDALYHPGDAFQAVYAVHSGSLKTVELAVDGAEQVLGFHLPGELVGLDAISEGRHPCMAVALEATSICAIPYPRLEDLAAQIPGLQRQLFRIMSREIFADHEMLHALARRRAEDRLAIILVSLADRFARRGLSRERLRLPMSRGELSNYLGLAPETLSRLLKRFEQQGLIAANGREITLLDRCQLDALAGRPDHGGSGRPD